MKIIISEDFTDTPGARYKEEGPFSGEEFRDDILLPKFKIALETGEKLIIDFDNVYGYAPGFIEEVFGGLKRVYNYDTETILNTLEFISNDEPELIDKIKEDIESFERKLEI